MFFLLIALLLLFTETFIPQCIASPDFLHAAMRPDMITETEVEISTEDCCEDEDEEMVTLIEEPEPDQEPIRKKRGKRKRVYTFTDLLQTEAHSSPLTSSTLWTSHKTCKKKHFYKQTYDLHITVEC